MKKFFWVFIITLFISNIFGLKPQAYNFKNEYYYDLYKKWHKNGNYRSNAISILNEDEFILDFEKRDSKKITTVIFEMSDYKAFRLRELIYPELIKIENYSENAIEYLEDFLFRLNAADKKFVNDFLNENKAKLQFHGKMQEQAIAELYLHCTLFHLKSVRIIENDISYKYVVFWGNSNHFTLELTKKNKINIVKSKSISNKNYSEDSEAINIKNKVKTEFSHNKKIKESVIKIPDFNITDKVSIQTIREDTIFIDGTIESYLANPNVKRKLLNNSITDPKEFLKNCFPNRDVIQKMDNIYNITTSNFQNLSSKITVYAKQSEEGVDFRGNIYQVIDDSLLLSSGDTINISILDLSAKETILPGISEFVNMHRALGTDLFNFLVFQEAITTSIVIRRNGDDSLFNFGYYVTPLVNLNEYWKKRDVYFNLTAIKKINGYYEIHGILTAVDTINNIQDNSDIRIHFNKDCKPDLIMMFIYPDIPIKN